MIDLKWNRDFALEQAGANEELLVELLNLFQKSTASDLKKINEGIRLQDAKEVYEAAHSIKGAADSLGIEGIRLIAYKIEKAGRNGDLRMAARDLTALETMVNQLKNQTKIT